jgi:lipopolysaccharide export system permease protein
MKRLYLYIVKSFVGPFIMTFFICVFILLMQFLWKYLDDLVGKGLENIIIIELMTYAAVSLIPMALPLSVLLASIMTFGNLGERLELLAMKASGISLLKIMRPLIIINVLVTLLAFFLSNNVVPATNTKFAALLYSVRSQRPEMIIKEGVFSNDMDGYSIKVSGRDPKSKALLDVMIYDHSEGKGNVSVTIADSGYLNMSDNKQYMILTLFNGESYNDVNPSDRRSRKTYPFRRERFDEQEVVIEVKDFELRRYDEKYFRDNYRMLSHKQIDYVVDSLEKVHYGRQKLLSTGIRYNDLLNSQIANQYKPDSINIDSILASASIIAYDSTYRNINKATRLSILNTAQRIAQQNQRVILQYQSDLYTRMIWINKHIIELHKKYTLSLACIMFFFIGAPLGAIIRKGGFGMPVVVSILLFMSYYLVSAIGEKVAREGVWDIDMVLWIPTLFYASIGIVFTHQAVSDSLLLNREAYNRFINAINPIKRIKGKSMKRKNNENTVLNQ